MSIELDIASSGIIEFPLMSEIWDFPKIAFATLSIDVFFISPLVLARSVLNFTASSYVGSLIFFNGSSNQLEPEVKVYFSLSFAFSTYSFPEVIPRALSAIVYAVSDACLIWTPPTVPASIPPIDSSIFLESLMISSKVLPPFAPVPSCSLIISPQVWTYSCKPSAAPAVPTPSILLATFVIIFFLVWVSAKPNASDRAAFPPPIPVILVKSPLSNPYRARFDANTVATSPMLSPPVSPACWLFLTLSSIWLFVWLAAKVKRPAFCATLYIAFWELLTFSANSFVNFEAAATSPALFAASTPIANLPAFVNFPKPKSISAIAGILSAMIWGSLYISQAALA